MIEATRCPDCEAVVERCCPDHLREHCRKCGATIDWTEADAVDEATLDAFTGGETA